MAQKVRNITRREILAIGGLLFALVFVALIAASSAVDRGGEFERYALRQPRLVRIMPGAGEELALDGDITFRFDQPMDRASVERAISTDPSVPLSFHWDDDRNLVAMPQPGSIKAASHLTVRVNATALDQEGLPLLEAREFVLDTEGLLKVTELTPADKGNVGRETTFRVIFSRPVVALGPLSIQQSLPNPLLIIPEVAGEGQWTSTSIYEFHPSELLRAGQMYTVSVKRDLTSVSGVKLDAPVTNTFKIEGPRVVQVSPDSSKASSYYYSSERYFGLDTPVNVWFNMPMDRTSTQAAFSLKQAGSDTAIGGNFAWNDDSTQMTFTPDTRLALSTDYLINVGTEALSADQYGTLSKFSQVRFSTVAPPKASMSFYSNNPYPVFSEYMHFNTEMDLNSLSQPGMVTISPAPLGEFTVRPWSYGIEIDARLRGSTQYTITLQAGAKDIYGNEITTPTSFEFRTAAYQSGAQINDGGFTGLYDASQPTRFVLATRNLTKVDFQLFHLTVDEFKKWLLSGREFLPGGTAKIRGWTEEINAPPDEVNVTTVNAAEDGGALPMGIYFLRGNYPGKSNYRNLDHILFVVNADLTMKHSFDQGMAWVTDLHTAEPLPNLPVTFYRDFYNYSSDNRSLREVKATTGPDGTAIVELPERASFDYYEYEYSAASTMAIVDTGQVFAVALSNWNSGITAESFGIQRAYNKSDQTLYLYTDRPIYRPGQEVFFRGILRDREDMQFSLPVSTTEVQVHVYNYETRGEVDVFNKSVAVSDQGTFSGSFILEENVPLGRYGFSVTASENRRESETYDYYYYYGSGDATFEVAEYRKPEFEVKVTPQATQILTGETVPVTINATFYSGGPVSTAAVTWRAKSYDAAFSYTGPGRYRFSDARDYWSYFYYYGYSRSRREELDIYDVIAEGEGVTDKQGNLTINVPTSSLVTGSTNEVYIEAEVRDKNGLAVSGHFSVMAYPSLYFVGISSSDYWGGVGEPRDLRVLVVDGAGNPMAGKTVSVQVNTRDWQRTQVTTDTGRREWEYTEISTPVGDPILVTTNESGEASFSVSLPSGGSYRIRATVTDERGGSHRSSAFMWASQYGTPWVSSLDTEDKVDMLPNKASYEPGETAIVLINNPFDVSVNALVTVERQTVISSEVLKLTPGPNEYRVPLTPEHAPDVYVSATMIRAIDENNRTPDFKMGLTQLIVAPTAQTLNVSITPASALAEPGQTTKVRVNVTDLSGQGQKAEVSLALVDAAVLSLKKSETVNILDHFYAPRRLGVMTSQPLTVMVERFLVDLLPEQLGCECGGGGAGGGGPGTRQIDPVRDEFKDTAYWNATIQTDESGFAEVSVPLPDNLTVWHLDARAVTADTHVGQGEADLQVSRPLLIRPQTPRFFIAGDRAVLGAIVNNNTGQNIQAVVTLEAAGVTLEGASSQMVTVLANDRVLVEFPVRANAGADWADLVFKVDGGGYQDGARPEIGDPEHDRMLPIYRYTVYEPVATAGQIIYEGSRTEYVDIPPSLDASQGGLTVNVQHSLAATTLDGLTWLKHYEYECNEQLTSKLLPNSVTLSALHELGIDDPALEAELTEQRDIGIARLLARQKQGGGWGLWPDDPRDPLVTAHVLHGLIEARRAGGEVEFVNIQKAYSYLLGAMKQKFDTERFGQNQSAYIVYVLTRAETYFEGVEDGAYAEAPQVGDDATPARRITLVNDQIETLYTERDSLSLYAKALLAQAIWYRSPNDSRLNTLRAELLHAADVTATTAHWEETLHDYYNWNTDTRTTAIVLDTFTLVWPNNDIGPNATRWLVSVRTNDHWSTTQETTWSLIALTDWMRTTHELQANYDWSVKVGDREVAGGHADEESLTKTTPITIDLQAMMNDGTFTIDKDDGAGRLYYTGQLVTYPNVESVTAANRGLIISRRYLNSDGLAVTGGKVGDVLTVEVTVIASTSRHYVIIEDYYPAGAEPLNPDLLNQPLSDKKQILEAEDPFSWRWGWSWFSHAELRDEKAIFSANYLSAGTYVMRYQIRLGTAGDYHVIPTTGWEFYFPDVYGRSDGMMFTILPQE